MWMSQKEKTHDFVLVLQWQAGDLEAFGEVYRRCHGLLKYYVRGIANTPEAADDLALGENRLRIRLQGK